MLLLDHSRNFKNFTKFNVKNKKIQKIIKKTIKPKNPAVLFYFFKPSFVQPCKPLRVHLKFSEVGTHLLVRYWIFQFGNILPPIILQFPLILHAPIILKFPNILQFTLILQALNVLLFPLILTRVLRFGCG